MKRIKSKVMGKGYVWRVPSKGVISDKNLTVSSIAKRMLREPASSVPLFRKYAMQLGLDPESTIAAVVAAVMVRDSIRGESGTLKQLLDRTDGPVAGVQHNLIGRSDLPPSDEELMRIIRGEDTDG